MTSAMDTAAWLKEFLYDRTIFAVAALEGVAIIWLVGMLVWAWRQRFNDARAYAQERRTEADRERRNAERNEAELKRLAEALTALVQKTVRRARYSSSASPVPFTPPPALAGTSTSSEGEDK